MEPIDPSETLLNTTESLQTALNWIRRVREQEDRIRLLRDQTVLLSRRECVISYLIAQVREYRRQYGILPECSALDTRYFETDLYGDVFRGRLTDL